MSLEAGDAPAALAVADLTGDGELDLVVADFSGSLRVFLGTGVGGFLPTSEIPLGGGPIFIAVGLFDADEHQDLAVARRLDDRVSILLGDGFGGFLPTEEHNAGGSPIALAVGDFDGDANPDLAVVARDDDLVRVLLGNGQGSFALAPEAIDVGISPRSVAIGDFDRDGDEDLAVVNRDGDSVSIRLGEGDGRFFGTDEVGVGDAPESVTVADLDGDGDEDLAVANVNDDSVSILLGDGLGGFTRLAEDFHVGPVPPGAIRDFPKFIATGDFNGDGNADLAVAKRDANALAILIGDGLAGFARIPDVPVGNDPRFIDIGDFDGDGAQDLAVVNLDSASVSVLPGNGLGSFARRRDVDAGNFPRSVAAGDFDADGRMDLAVASSDLVSILLGDGKGEFSPMDRFPVGASPESVAVGDFDHDGRGDLAVADGLEDAVYVLLEYGEGGFARTGMFPVGFAPESVAVGDFNADGHMDLAVPNSHTLVTNTLSVLLGDGSGGFPPDTISTLPVLEPGPGSVAVVDLGTDGVLDLVVTSRENAMLTVLRGDGLGGFLRASSIPVGSDPNSVAVGHFNPGDAPDLAVANRSSGTVSILLADAVGGFDRSDIAVGGAPWSVAAADFNADGTADLVVADRDLDAVSILPANRLGGFEPPVALAVGVAPRSIVVGDFDSDGVPDVAVANSESDTLSTLLGQVSARIDLNGSNRIDGFDVGAIGRFAGAERCDPTAPACQSEYRRNVDVDLNGEIDGHDLSLVCSRFGEMRRAASPLRAVSSAPPPSLPDTVTLQPLPSQGDLLSVDVLVSDSDDAVAEADFIVTFGPDLDDPDQTQVLKAVGFLPGTYMSGFVRPFYLFDDSLPGRLEIGVVPFREQTGSGGQPLITLLFEARRVGQVDMAFDPSSRLLDSTGGSVASFVSDALRVQVDSSAGGPPGQKIGFAPELLDFGSVAPYESARRTLRISNFGFSEAEVSNPSPLVVAPGTIGRSGVGSTLTEFTALVPEAFTVPPFGFVEATVEFSTMTEGFFSGDLVLTSGPPADVGLEDPPRVAIHIPVLARAGSSLNVTPPRLDFGRVPVSVERNLRLRIANLGGVPLTLEDARSSDPHFIPETDSPMVLDPGATLTVSVRFTPETAREFRATLAFNFAEDSQAVITLVGSGDPDGDEDGVADRLDNCPDDANPGQDDTDLDGIGDACDPA